MSKNVDPKEGDQGLEIEDEPLEPRMFDSITEFLQKNKKEINNPDHQILM